MMDRVIPAVSLSKAAAERPIQQQCSRRYQHRLVRIESIFPRGAALVRPHAHACTSAPPRHLRPSPSDVAADPDLPLNSELIARSWLEPTDFGANPKIQDHCLYVKSEKEAACAEPACFGLLCAANDRVPPLMERDLLPMETELTS